MNAAVLPAPPPGMRLRPFKMIRPDLGTADLVRAAQPDEVLCIGPLIPGEEDSEFGRRCYDPHDLARHQRTYIVRVEQGRYILVWRVPHGRSRGLGRSSNKPSKLAHWDALEEGVAMMLHPEPNDDAIDSAIGRATYLRAQDRGCFQPFFDDAGALWVARLP